MDETIACKTLGPAQVAPADAVCEWTSVFDSAPDDVYALHVYEQRRKPTGPVVGEPSDEQARAACCAFYCDPRGLSFDAVAIGNMKRALAAAGVQAAPVAGKHECEWDDQQQTAIAELLDTLDIIDCQLYSNAWTYMLEQYVATKAAGVRSVVMVDPLSDDEEAHVAACEHDWQGRAGTRAAGLIAIIRKRFPAPAVKTPGQVLCEALNTSSWERADREFYEKGAAAVLAAHGAAK